MALDYVITNNNKVFVKLNDNGLAETCSKPLAQHFTYDKAKNILDHLPKHMKKFHFKVVAVPEIPIKTDKKSDEHDAVKKKQEKKVIQKENYILSENITQWIEKIRLCDDVITEAKERKEKLYIALSNTDKELNNELHKIELEKSKNACEGFYEYKRIKCILENRRDIKDELMIISHVLQADYTYLRKESVRKVVDGLAKRKYTFRVIEEEGELNAM